MDTLKSEIAAIAARLVVEEAMDYGAAKRHALKQLGLPKRMALPDNEMVQAAVREHIDLFHSDTQPAELAALRRLALTWMERLAPFRPYLTGPVWQGTATRLNDIELQLFCDDPKAAEIELIDQRIEYRVHCAGGPRGEPVDVITVPTRSAELEDQPVQVHLMVCDHDDLRGALKPDACGKTRRGSVDAVRALLDESGRSPPLIQRENS